MATLRQLVDPPVIAPLPNGLLSVVDFRPNADTHWYGGISWRSNCQSAMGGTTYDECIAVTGVGGPPPAPQAGTFTATNVNTIRGASPFTVYARFVCSPVGLGDATNIARAALAQVESWQAENAFWTGNAGGQPVVFPHLVASASVFDSVGVSLQSAPVTGGSATTDVADGLGILEGAMANMSNGVGVVHIPQFALPTFVAYNLVDTSGPRMRTKAGNLVSVGAGYTGSSPTGVSPPAGTTWIYGTGPIFGYRGDVEMLGSPSESLDRAKNTMSMVAARRYVLGMDCSYAAVQIQLGVPAV